MSGATPGPYWVRTNTNGSHDVCGAHAKVIRSYRPDQIAMADADCRLLHRGHLDGEKALREAAPDLLAALVGLTDIINRAESNASGNPEWEAVSKRVNAARAAISKAEGRS